MSAALARLSEVPVRVREQWAPDSCPTSLLPWLAWGLSVDTWDPAWTAAQKRAAISASFYVHQRKGTLGALRAALSALGFSVRVVEWFEDSPAAAPYTFRLTVGVEQIGAVQSRLLPIISVADAAKNLRSHLTSVSVEVTSRAESPVVGASTASGNEITILPG